MPYIKGQSGNNKGKPKGAKSKVLIEARKLFNITLEGQVPFLMSAFDEVRKEDPAMFLKLFAQYAQFFVPKKIDHSSSDGSMNYVPISQWTEQPKVINPNGNKPSTENQ
jgi:hypothetical protein